MSWQADYAAHLDSQAFAEEMYLDTLRDDSTGFPSLPTKRPDPAMEALALAEWNKLFKNGKNK